MLFQSTLEVFWIEPSHIVLLSKHVVVGLRFRHVNLHVCGNFNQVITSHTVFLVIIMSENVVDILIFNEIIRNCILITYRKWKIVFDGINENSIAKNVAIKCQQERKTTTIDTLEEGTHAESHHALSCTREIVEKDFIYGRS